MQEPAAKRVSLIVPCYNESASLSAFLARIRAVADGLPQYDWEFLFIDDGSRDNTEALLVEEARREHRIKIVALSRNFGHQRALMAGLDHAGGGLEEPGPDYVVIIDADLQDPPELIPEMLSRLEAGDDVVHTVRSDRRADSLAKRACAGVFYALMRRYVLPELPLNAADYKAFNNRVLEVLRQYPERVRFLRGLIATLGFRQSQVEFVRPARANGVSGYSPTSILRLARDAIVSNTVIPLRLGLYFGVLVLIFLPPYAAICIYLHWFDGGLDAPWVCLLLGVNSAFFALCLILLGGIGEYLKCIVLEVKRRPLYIVRDRHNF